MFQKITASVFCLFFISVSIQTFAQPRTIDTLVDVGGYAMHFVVIEGRGTPILFEAGGGEDASTWKDILQPVSQITGAPLIAYDRPGFGKSGMDTVTHGIIHNIEGLETALKKLGFGGAIMYVAHSQGGLYAQVFAYRHPNLVKTAVLIDATTACFYQPQRLATTQLSINQSNARIRYTHPGTYFQGADFSNNIEVARRSPFPTSIPVIDFVSEKTPFTDSIEAADWKRCHREFAAAAANRTGIMAWGCGHFIFADNPPLVITAIAKAYTSIQGKEEAKNINARIVDYNLQTANETKKQEAANRHSEDAMNSWGYELLRAGDTQKALEVFKLNTLLYPASWNVYDSYGEVLLQTGDKTEAIKMYRKSVELNPSNEHGKKVLNEIAPN